MILTCAASCTGTLLSSRSSLIRAAEDVGLPEGVAVVDLWSVDDSWENHVDTARRTSRTVVLSSIGVDAATSPYLEVLARREQVARRALDAPTVLRLAPIVEDLKVYAAPLATGETVFHAYTDEPVPWLAAGDVVRFAVRAMENPATFGSTFDLFGPASTPVLHLLRTWAEQIGSISAFAAVPPDVLVGQLGAVLGANTAAAVVGHQQWCGSALSPTDPAILRSSALARALTDPTPWHRALRQLTKSPTASKEKQR